MRWLILLLGLLVTMPACADNFIVPTPLSMLQTMLRFGALDISNDVVIDDYAKIAECDLFKTFFPDEFKWYKIRDGLRNKIRSEAITYPTDYVVIGGVNLDRYDFQNKIFLLDKTSPIMGVNAFVLFSIGVVCDNELRVLPHTYLASIDNAINIPGFIMSESDASAMLDRLNAVGNLQRKIIAKFNLRIIDSPKVKIQKDNPDAVFNPKIYLGLSDRLVMNARLESVEFFEDAQQRRRIAIFQQ